MGKPSVFKAKKIEFTAPQIEAAEEHIKHATGLTDETMDREHFRDHVSQVQELTDKIIDLFEAGNYETTVSLDALETVLKGGVSTTLGDDAGELLTVALKDFHKQLTLLQIMKLFDGLARRPEVLDISGMDKDEASAALKKKLDEMK
jgi:hypothetical protein